jgi:hypothetical protein
MGLEETARELQKQEESHALKFLRKMRGVRSEYTEDRIQKQWDSIQAYADGPEGETEAGKEHLCRMIADAWKMRQMREFSGEILTAAEKAEKQKKGGGEEWARLSLPLIRHRLEYIDTEHRKMQQYQLALEE